jgi:cell shape-determining protein MreC
VGLWGSAAFLDSAPWHYVLIIDDDEQSLERLAQLRRVNRRLVPLCKIHQLLEALDNASADVIFVCGMSSMNGYGV